MELWWGKVNDLLVNVPKVTLHCLCMGHRNPKQTPNFWQIKASAIVVDRQKNETLTKVHQLRIKQFKLNVLRLKLINSFGGYHITC